LTSLTESFHGLDKTEMVRHGGPWRSLDDVEHANQDYIDWFNHRRLHGELRMVPPAEFEASYYAAVPPQPATSQ
jgi:putative transposase